MRRRRGLRRVAGMAVVGGVAYVTALAAIGREVAKIAVDQKLATIDQGVEAANSLKKSLQQINDTDIVCRSLTVKRDGKPMVTLRSRKDVGEPDFEGNIVVHGYWGESPCAVNIETVNGAGFVQVLDQNSNERGKLP